MPGVEGSWGVHLHVGNFPGAPQVPTSWVVTSRGPAVREPNRRLTPAGRELHITAGAC